MLPYAEHIDRIREGERVTQHINHYIQRYGFQLANVSFSLNLIFYE